jgi:hypothetical protein
MLGSVADAEDMLQEAFIRWQQSSKQEVRSPRAYLVTIISRLCLNYLQSARVQRAEYVGEWLPEPIVTALASDPLGMIRVLARSHPKGAKNCPRMSGSNAAVKSITSGVRGAKRLDASPTAKCPRNMVQSPN